MTKVWTVVIPWYYQDNHGKRQRNGDYETIKTFVHDYTTDITYIFLEGILYGCVSHAYREAEVK